MGKEGEGEGGRGRRSCIDIPCLLFLLSVNFSIRSFVHPFFVIDSSSPSEVCYFFCCSWGVGGDDTVCIRWCGSVGAFLGFAFVVENIVC